MPLDEISFSPSLFPIPVCYLSCYLQYMELEKGEKGFGLSESDHLFEHAF